MKPKKKAATKNTPKDIELEEETDIYNDDDF